MVDAEETERGNFFLRNAPGSRGYISSPHVGGKGTSALRVHGGLDTKERYYICSIPPTALGDEMAR